MNKQKVTARQHDQYKLFTIIAILLPVISIILGIVYLTKSDAIDRKLGEHALSLGVVFLIVWGAIFSFFNYQRVVNSLDTTSDYGLMADEPEEAPIETVAIGKTVDIGGLAVTVDKIIDPATHVYGNTSAERIAAVSLQLKNNAPEARLSGNANVEVTIIGSDDQMYDVVFDEVSECENFSFGEYKIASGAKVRGCVGFALPDGVTISRVQFEKSSLNPTIGEWQVR